jgi:hypothetical protein
MIPDITNAATIPDYDVNIDMLESRIAKRVVPQYFQKRASSWHLFLKLDGRQAAT